MVLLGQNEMAPPPVESIFREKNNSVWVQKISDHFESQLKSKIDVALNGMRLTTWRICIEKRRLEMARFFSDASISSSGSLLISSSTPDDGALAQEEKISKRKVAMKENNTSNKKQTTILKSPANPSSSSCSSSSTRFAASINTNITKEVGAPATMTSALTSSNRLLPFPDDVRSRVLEFMGSGKETFPTASQMRKAADEKRLKQVDGWLKYILDTIEHHVKNEGSLSVKFTKSFISQTEASAVVLGEWWKNKQLVKKIRDLGYEVKVLSKEDSQKLAVEDKSKHSDENPFVMKVLW